MGRTATEPPPRALPPLLPGVRLRASLRTRRGRALAVAPGRTVVTVAGDRRIALLQRGLSPVRARRAAVVSVTRALRGAGVDYFCVRGAPRRPGIVAVPAAQRRRACLALARLCRTQPAYVTAVAARPGALGPGTLAPLTPGYEPGVWRRLAGSDVLRLTWFRTEPSRRLVLGEESGCEIEFWRREDDRLLAPRPGRVAASVAASAAPVNLADTAGSWGCGLLTLRTRREFAELLPDDVTFPVDAVCTAYGAELRYALRSLATYAPWLRHVHLVAEGGPRTRPGTRTRLPDWLDATHPGLTVVPAAEDGRLPRVEGLAEHSLYLGDGVFLGAETVPQDFFPAPAPAPVPVPPEGLDRLLAARDRTVFRLGGEPPPESAPRRCFLEAYFPVPSTYELPR